MQRLVLIAILVSALAAFSRGHRNGSVRASVASERSPQTIGPRSDSIRLDRSLEPDRRLDGSVVLLGLDNGRTYRIDVRNELLILHRDEIAIDTVVTGSIDHYEPAIVTFDSTILAYEAVSRGMPTMGDTYLFCVLADTLHTAAKFMSWCGFHGGYDLDLMERRGPFALTCRETMTPYDRGTDRQLPTIRRSTRLRFDTNRRIFLTDLIRLDSVRTQDPATVYDGVFPGIALGESTTVYIDGCWQWLWPTDGEGPDLRRRQRRTGRGAAGDVLSGCTTE